MGKIGIEPTQTSANGFTDRPNSPTLAFPLIKMGVKVGFEPTILPPYIILKINIFF